MPDMENVVRLKKNTDAKIIGPMTITDLKQLAESALVSPEDFYDQGDDDWKPVWELEALEMVWKINATDGSSYGPTTLGTIKEFLVAGELTPQDKVLNTKTNLESTVLELLGPSVAAPSPSAEEHIDDTPAPKEDVPQANGEVSANNEEVQDTTVIRGQDIAKDLRIRQLELDYTALQREHDNLLHEFRKLSEQFASIKK